MLILYLMLFLVSMIIYKLFNITWTLLYKIKINNILESINTKEDLLYTHYKDFINVIAEILKRKGYKVKITDKCGEEGYGLILDNLQYVDLSKHGLSHIVEVETAMKFAKCMCSNSIFRGMLITLGDFKQNTRLFCHKNVIQCINGDQLLAICKEVQKKREVLRTG